MMVYPTESGKRPPGAGQKSSQKKPDTRGDMPTLLREDECEDEGEGEGAC